MKNSLFSRRDFLARSVSLTAVVTLAPLFSLSPGQASAQTAQFAEGVVFEDKNGNGVRDAGERGIGGIAVSNGREVVKTDKDGRWRLPVDDPEHAVFFVIKPSGWKTPVSAENLPRFSSVHRPNGSPADYKYPGLAPTGPLPASIDFPLVRSREQNSFRVLLWGDPQPRDQKEIDYIAHDLVEELSGAKDEAVFGISLGDIMFDDLSLYDSLNRTMATIGLPWYNLVGNHDLNYDSPDDKHSMETFQRVYGSPYYAFDYGPAHFLVLDDVHWKGKGNGYTAGLGERQMAFIENDLALVPKEKLVVLCLHIPLTDTAFNDPDHPAHAERLRLFELLQDRPRTVSFSAHTHFQEHHFLGKDAGWKRDEPHHHINHVTACGSWWSGALDEQNIPHTTMRCGAPNGYSFLDIDNDRYRLTFKAARRPAEHQMTIHAPEEVAGSDSQKSLVTVNFFTGSEKSKVTFRVDNANWQDMRQVEKPDPYYAAMKALEVGPNPPTGRKLPEIIASPHLWEENLPSDLRPGMHTIEVRATNTFGQTYFGRRLIRVA